MCSSLLLLIAFRATYMQLLAQHMCSLWSKTKRYKCTHLEIGVLQSVFCGALEGNGCSVPPIGCNRNTHNYDDFHVYKLKHLLPFS